MLHGPCHVLQTRRDGPCYRNPRGALGTQLTASNTVRKLGKLRCRVNASAEQTPEMRDTIKRLTKLFYFDRPSGSTAKVVQNGTSNTPKLQQLGARIDELPLWRVEWSVLPGSQEILHVMAPHYVHMFEGLFSRPRPWQFGHLYLPGGSRNLGASSFELSSGSRAPLIGTLAQVTRAVRLRDGKFLILATAVSRFKVRRCVQELPYSVADVELFEDVETLEAFNQPALTALMQAAPADSSINTLMAAGSVAAREVCAAVSWAWLRGYELRVACQQEWPGPGPREGESDLETHIIVQELMAHGVSEVLPLPDGVVIGQVKLTDVSAAADAAQQRALHSAVQALQRGQESENAVTAASAVDDTCDIVSLNTTGERGIKFESSEFSELVGSSSSSSIADVLMLEAAIWAQLDTLVALASRVKGSRHTALPFGLLQLRPEAVTMQSMLWGSAAGAAAAAAAAGGNKPAAPGHAPEPTKPGHTLECTTATNVVEDSSGSKSADGAISSRLSNDAADSNAAGTEQQQQQQQQADPSVVYQQQQEHKQDAGSSRGSSSRDSTSGTDEPVDQQMSALAKYAFAASDGMDVHADPMWPPLRRAARLSWAAAVVAISQMDYDKGEVRQALLETASIAQRLRFVSAVLSKHVKVLSALAAVRDVENN